MSIVAKIADIERIVDVSGSAMKGVKLSIPLTMNGLYDSRCILLTSVGYDQRINIWRIHRDHYKWQYVDETEPLFVNTIKIHATHHSVKVELADILTAENSCVDTKNIRIVTRKSATLLEWVTGKVSYINDVHDLDVVTSPEQQPKSSSEDLFSILIVGEGFEVLDVSKKA